MTEIALLPYSLKTDGPSVAKNYDFVSADWVTGGRKFETVRAIREASPCNMKLGIEVGQKWSQKMIVSVTFYGYASIQGGANSAGNTAHPWGGFFRRWSAEIS